MKEALKRIGTTTAILMVVSSLGVARKAKAPKPSGCAAAYFCVSGLDWLYVRDNSVYGFFENRSNATVANFNITFALRNDGVITGSATAVSDIPLPPGGHSEIRAPISQNFERYDSTIESASIFLCHDFQGKRSCGEENATLWPPLFGPGAWRQKRAWMKANGFGK